ncbi:hypothetical protein [Bradyrhizobium elkanii]|uniref:Uncharacterized protein n=1 Tax=Bradyrhizobium diazoefficiens TaxID=1355477 RepID=A0A809ZD68_9BRAD|nr:hypothetical protein [Bradyrhizobium elkanii]BCE22073.1 hypothetical protein XF1B_47540 [Bradyrhizobium diazoefficiens]WLB04129.1 hypothetical protein QNJ80_19950 [Bradyrhizobium elkanii]WLB84940.1 hypothetical protein QIH83_21285 [Bradyrhizobium elkanii]BCE48338.1 hypothetical protein XF4B_46870 [Bradyrhizobium diazoefficiens]BCE91854.1 hypothetical protein XF10B_46520 [Bradyrhizobium diazoefficiens]
MSASNKSKSKWILVRKVDGHLIPHAAYDVEMFQSIPENVPVRAQFAQPRSGPRHRLYRVILRIVTNNTDLFASEESLHDTLLLANGVVRPVMTTAGEIIMIPSSTAFDAMGEEDFKAYFDAALETIQSHIIPGIDLDELLKEARAQSNYKAANDNDERRNEEAA